MQNSKCVVNPLAIGAFDFQIYKLNNLEKNASICATGCESNGAFICTSCIDGARLVNAFCEFCNVTNCKKCDENKVIN